MVLPRPPAIPRPPREFLQGRAMVLWSHALEPRAAGDDETRFHHAVREALLHTGARHGLVTACYVLLPGWCHVVWAGLGDETDQARAAVFFRRQLTAAGGEWREPLPRAEVVGSDQRRRPRLDLVCDRVCGTAKQARLGGDRQAEPLRGAAVPGYPQLDPRARRFWPAFWKIYHDLTRAADRRSAPWVRALSLQETKAGALSTRTGRQAPRILAR